MRSPPARPCLHSSSAASQCTLFPAVAGSDSQEVGRKRGQRHRHWRRPPNGSRSPHPHSVVIGGISRSGSGPTPGPSAACSPTGRPAHSCCRTPRKAGGDHAGISHPGFGQLRTWQPHANRLDPSLQEAPLPVVSTAAPGVSAPTPCTWFPPTCLLEVLKILLTDTCSRSHSLCTPGPVMWVARHGSSHAPSGSFSKWLESA